MEHKINETRIAKLWLDNEEILHCEIKSNSGATLDDANEIFAARKDLIGNSVVPLLVNLKGAISITREARTFFAGEEFCINLLAVALLVDSGISKVLGNFFIGLNKLFVTTKLYTSESEALEWLKGLKNDQQG